MVTRVDEFWAGPSPVGDTEDLANLTNAVIVTAGCQNGVVFPNLTYHAYDNTRQYVEFPERHCLSIIF